MNRAMALVCLAVLGLVAGAAISFTRGRASQPAAPSSPAQAPAPAEPSPVIAVGDAKQLEQLLAAHHGAALLDFHAQWCEPCKALEPRVAELARKRPQLLVASIDVVAAEALGNAWRAEDLPVLVRLQDGKEVARQVGAPTLPELEAWLDQPPKP